MAEGMVTMKLIFWHKDKQPGDLVEVRPEDVRSWHGFAEPVEEKGEPAAEQPADKAEEPVPEAPAVQAASAKTTAAAKAKQG